MSFIINSTTSAATAQIFIWEVTNVGGSATLLSAPPRKKKRKAKKKKAPKSNYGRKLEP